MLKKSLFGAHRASLAVHTCLQDYTGVFLQVWYTLSILNLVAVKFFKAFVLLNCEYTAVTCIIGHSKFYVAIFLRRSR